MIEVLARSWCTGCGLCVRVCPMNVFEGEPRGAPRIARQRDCQACFMCEAYCPADALFVVPPSGAAEPGSPYLDKGWLEETGRFGSHRSYIGWGPGRIRGSRFDRNHRFTREAWADE